MFTMLHGNCIQEDIMAESGLHAEGSKEMETSRKYTSFMFIHINLAVLCCLMPSEFV